MSLENSEKLPDDYVPSEADILDAENSIRAATLNEELKEEEKKPLVPNPTKKGLNKFLEKIAKSSGLNSDDDLKKEI